MDNDIYDPDFPARKRKKRGEPRLDFDDPKVKWWVMLLRMEHPELFPSAFMNLTRRRILEQHFLLNDPSTLITMPEKPKLTGKNLTKNEWDVWLCYYCVMQDCGFTITPQEIADLTGRDLITVNSAFKAAKRRIEKMDAETVVKRLKAEEEKLID